MRQSPAVATMFRALLPAAMAGDDVALKLRSRISMASRSGMCVAHQDAMADEMLLFLAPHLDHSPDCPFYTTAVTVVQRLIEIGLDDIEHFTREVRTE